MRTYNRNLGDHNPRPVSRKAAAGKIRIVGGRLGGRIIRYSGDPQVRPMKDRTREAVFNVLGTTVTERHVVDLFAGTGAMAIEAVSRGASSAIAIERHPPTARLIRENVRMLGVETQFRIVTADVFRWSRNGLDELPMTSWIIFCCPPYRYYAERFDDLRAMLLRIQWAAPPGSQLVVEAELPFDFEQLELCGSWEVRQYRPAVVGFVELNSRATQPSEL
jgi:16S rRNA (guanine966-N2)-methyltransferase